MTIDASQIIESSNIMFQILNSAQQEIIDKNDKIVEINIIDAV